MKGICYQVFQTLFAQNRCLVMMVFLSFNILGAYGGNTYNRPKVQVNANPTGAGNVYVSRTQGDKTSQTADGEYGGDGDTKTITTFYFSADHIEEDYLWYAWISQNGTVALTQKNASLSLSVNSQDTYGSDSNTQDKKDGNDYWYSYLFHFTAKWVQPDVTGVTNGTANGTRQSTYDLGTVTNPTATTKNVAFTLSNDYAGLLDINDVCPDYYSVATPLASHGYTNGNISHTKGSGSLTVPVIYTPAGIHGQTNSASLTVKSNYPSAGTNCWTAVFSVAENYKPSFTLSDSYNFTPTTPIKNATSSNMYALPITNRNYAAEHVAEWEVSWSDVTYAGGAYTLENPYIVDVTANGGQTPTVTFIASAEGSYVDIQATLTIKCKYRDASGNLIESDPQTITFSADVGDAVKIDDVKDANYDFGQVTYDGSIHTHSLSYATNMTGLVLSWQSGTYFEHQIDGENIVITLKSTAIPADYTDRLSVKSGETEVASLSVSAMVRLAKPELQANGDKECVLLEWNEIYGATQYIIKSGDEIATLTAAEAQAAGYEYTVTSIADTPVEIGNSYPFTITAVYGSDASIAEKISVSDEKTAIPTAYLYTITIDNAGNLGIATGLKNGLTLSFGSDDAYSYPSKPQWDVDVSSTFDKDGNALFDRLYIFGITTGPGGGNVQGYVDPEMPNAITPCYIYEKRSDDKAYEHKFTIDNMNVDNKNKTWFDVSLNKNEEKKIYLTGWCPFGTTGYTIDEHGLLYITGYNTSRIDIYLENCYLYARLHHSADKGGGWGAYNLEYDFLEYSYANILEALNLFSPDGLGSGAKGAASAIIIESKSTNEAFNANIHVKGDNLVYSHLGSPLRAKVDVDLSWLGYGNIQMDERMGQYSAPIFVRPQSKDSQNELTMDDIWPTDKDGKLISTHTNGYLKFDKYYRAAPSIDLGNKNTILNFNGGRFELAANLPIQTNYPNNLAICARDGSFTMDALPVPGYVYNGMAGDATVGQVYINDGSVWVTRFSPAIKTWAGTDVDNTDFFDDIVKIDGKDYSQTLRLPAMTYVRGGSHKGYIRACSELLSSGSTPSDGYSALEQRVYEVSDDDIENGFVKEAYFTNTDPLGLYKRELVTPSEPSTGATEMLLETYYETYKSHYSSVGGSYGRAAISPEVEDGKKKIYLWVPGEAKHPVTFSNWFFSIPYIKADPPAGLGVLGLNIEFGTETTVPYATYDNGEDQHVIKNLWRVEMDDNLLSAAKELRTLPAKIDKEYHFIDLNNTSFGGNKDQMGDDLYADIENATDYKIRNKIYSIRMARADEWMLFCPQFDVKNIYILEVCNEAYLKNLSDVTPIANGGGRENALLAQAVFNLDMTAVAGANILTSSDDRSLWDYYAKYSEYVGYINGYDGNALVDMTDSERKRHENIILRKPFYQSYNPELNSIRTKLQHLVKKGDGSFNYSDAHYYLYQTDATDWWIDTETNFLKINWQLAPASTKAADGTTDVVMKKGQVYAMQFPYCPGCNDESKWDYWTGKMIVFEGEGPQTLSGSNEHDIIKATEAGGFHGNYTFSDISVSNTEMKNAYFNYAGYMIDNAEGAVESLRSGESFVILPTSVHSSMPGKRIKSINAETGAITWEEGDDNQNTTTGTPTISGNRQMMVYTIEGGVGIIPVTAQQVSIYNAAGQLITSQYLTEEVQISLPAGIYLISGEKEQAKAIVR